VLVMVFVLVLYMLFISLLTIPLLNLQLFVVGKERRHKEIVTKDHERDLHTII